MEHNRWRQVTSYFYHLFLLFIHNSLYISHNLQSQEIQGVSHVPKLIQVLRGRSSYVKLNSNAVRRCTIQARSWKYTPKIGFWTTWLHSRHLVNGSGSFEPLLQYRIQIVRKLPTVSLFKCFTARALFPNSKSSRAILWRELLCLLQTDIKTPHWALCISPMSSSMKWEMWTSQIWWWQRTQRMKMFRAFSTLMALEKAWASIVTTDGKYLVNNIIIIKQVLDTCAWSDPLEFSAWTTPRRVLVLSPISGDVTLTAVL